MNRKIGCVIMSLAFIITSLPGVAFCADESKAPASAPAQPAAQDAPSSTTAPSSAPAPAPAVTVPTALPASPAVPAQQQPAEEVAPTDPGHVTVNFKGADIRTVLAYISEVAGVDIVVAPDVKETIDAKLTNKPWKGALGIITNNYNLGYEEANGIIRVMPIGRMKKLSPDEENAKLFEEMNVEVFPINYGKAKDISKIIVETIIKKGDKPPDAWGKTEYGTRETYTGGGAIESGTKLEKAAAQGYVINDMLKIAFDERTNTVTVIGLPFYIKKIGKMIKELDQPPLQVLIEARVFETTLGDDEKMGIDWTPKITVTGAKRPTTLPFSYYASDSKYLDKYLPLVQTGVEGTEYLAASLSTVTTAPGLYPNSADAADGSKSKAFPYVDFTQDIMKNTFMFGTLDFSEFKAVLEMIKNRANTNVVANPRIMTLNNEIARIDVGQTLNMPKYERNSTTGKMEIIGYVAFDLGVLLSVKPHINCNDEITVELFPKISELIRYDTLSEGVVAPIIGQRQADTRVMIKDGETIFIGGLIKENTYDRKKTLPIIGDMLGDVPYLGLAFSRTEKITEKKELIFFITVTIVRPGKKISSVPDANKIPLPASSVLQQVETKALEKKKAKVKKNWLW